MGIVQICCLDIAVITNAPSLTTQIPLNWKKHNLFHIRLCYEHEHEQNHRVERLMVLVQ